MTDLSPLDILGKSFSKRLHGCDPEEVQAFLNVVASAMETALRDRGELRQRVHRLETELAQFRERESALHEALVSAQRSADETIDKAQADGERIIHEAQNLADNLVDEANERARNIELVIGDLRSKRREARSEVMRLVEVLQGIVEDDKSLEKQERISAHLTVMRRSHNG